MEPVIKSKLAPIDENMIHMEGKAEADGNFVGRVLGKCVEIRDSYKNIICGCVYDCSIM